MVLGSLPGFVPYIKWAYRKLRRRKPGATIDEIAMGVEELKKAFQEMEARKAENFKPSERRSFIAHLSEVEKDIHQSVLSLIEKSKAFKRSAEPKVTPKELHKELGQATPTDPA